MKDWGPRFSREMEELGLENTPQYDPHENETQNEQVFPQLIDELDLVPGVGHCYLGA